jgi:arsenate reductase
LHRRLPHTLRLVIVDLYFITTSVRAESTIESVAAEVARQHMPLNPMSTITIYHNTACGTSRNTLALIRNSGVEPDVIEYLKTPPSKATLQSLIAAMGISTRELLREKGTPYDALALAESHWTDDQLLDFMLAHPVLMNRPVVVTPLGTRLCRPSEAVLDLLPQAQQGAFAKEDGEKVIDDGGNRV